MFSGAENDTSSVAQEELSSTTAELNSTGGPEDGTSTTAVKKRTFSSYKRTLEEALACESVPIHEMYDLDTGYIQEECLRDRSPSPPSDTIVYEVGTGRPYMYVSGMSPIRRLHPDSVAFYDAREEAKAAAPTSPSGDLRRVIPLPLVHSVEKQSSGCDVAISLDSAPPTKLLEVCDCIDLVSCDDTHMDVLDKPDLAGEEDGKNPEIRRLLGGLLTLRYLYSGYRNCIVNDVSECVHKLIVYSCRSPDIMVYNTCRSISCVSKIEREARQQPPLVFRSMTIIQQYLQVFAALCDFNYSLTPETDSGICNVLVLNKVWKHNQARKIFIPHYRLLSNDGYTDLVINALKNNRATKNRGTVIGAIKFYSTSNTVLYTNRYAFFNLSTTKAPHSGPCQKTQQDATPGTSVMDSVASDHGPEDSVKNPTLVVFKQDAVHAEPGERATLACRIIVEIHLGTNFNF
ncbi:hypothetical protein J6590_055927 [Homalodisca vitripennis]|nr:hypothetical protein J6590_055927 [Homalodisca vitripennis]